MAAIGCWSTPVSADVRQVDLPSSARALSTLARVDYCDAFLFAVGSTHDESAEDLIREPTVVFNGDIECRLLTYDVPV